MCGIAGFIDFNKKSDKEKLIAMTDTMVNRGPDDSGYFFTENSFGQVGLGHRRLSIIDLSPAGHQPMSFQNLTIVFNGEIYNFEDIKKELEKEGYDFFSNSDTEVILKAYHKWGFASVSKFRGMWSFAIWDNDKKELILCRDRVGVKPLYWYFKNNIFIFGSELKAFKKHAMFESKLNYESLSLYLQYGYITSPYSIFENTYKLEPGHCLKIDKNKNIKKEKYWDIETFFVKGENEKKEWLNKSDEDVSEELEYILTESFKLRMVSDVPVGMFLSGGIDSSLVAALLQKEYTRPLKTFSIGFNEKEYNEAQWAKKVADRIGTEHTELYCTPKEALEVIPKIPLLYDEPFGDSSAIPTYIVSELAKRHVKVSLSGDGGDEQFCGYTKYWAVGEKIKKIRNIPFSNVFNTFLNALTPETAFKIYNVFKPALPKYSNFKDKYIKLRNVMRHKDLFYMYDVSNKYFLDEDISSLGLHNKQTQAFKFDEKEKFHDMSFMMYYDLKTYLPDDILVKVDRATMGVSLEGREPLLDNKILEFSSKLPLHFKYRNNSGKYILRKILRKYIPDELIERPKQGFGVPVYEWFKGDLKHLFYEYLSKDKIKKDGIFNADYVNENLDNYFNNKGINHNKLWLLFVFQMWKSEYL
jgi:asparagine synthase (glutamine-hydrolysing)